MLLLLAWLFIEKLVLISALNSTLDLKEGDLCSYEKYNGTCVKYYRCMSTFVGLHTKDVLPNCTSTSDDQIVCCPDCDLVKDTRKAVVFYNAGIKFWKGTRAHDKCLEYLSTLPYYCKTLQWAVNDLNWDENLKCKVKTGMRVAAVGGRPVERYEYPHMALLGYGDSLSSIEWLCGGSIISEKFVLTAAHCVSSKRLGNVTFVAVGMLKRTDPPEYWNHYAVKRIITYPEYKPPSKYHDIALLETETEIVFSSAVLPACLDAADDVFESRQMEILYATGWGQLGHLKPTADILQTVILEQFSDEECSKQYSWHRHLIYGFDNITQMCYGSHVDIKDTCQGDSGGPLQAEVNAGCQFDIIGVTSAGNPCGLEGGAGLYTRVQYYVHWIEDIVWPKNASIDSRLLDWLKEI